MLNLQLEPTPVEVLSTLAYLSQDECCELRDIDTFLELRQQLVAQRVDKLIKLGLLRKQVNKSDRRIAALVLTKSSHLVGTMYGKWQLSMMA